MESSQLYGGAEECHSSESGWTMYLGSSIHSDDDENNQHSYADYDHDDGVEIGGNGKNYYQVDDSDDSMASDASSGPSHQGVAHFKGQQDKLDYDYDDDGKYCSQRKSNKQVDDDGRRRRKYKKKEVGFKTRKANNNNNNNNNAPSESGSNKMVAG